MLSLVIPVFNEESLLEELLKRTVASLESFISDYEIIIVDDGSSDTSLAIALSYRKKNSKIKVLELSKNFGHQAAFTAGLEYARGEYVAMMDGDLQDPPEILNEMYRMLREDDFDIVSGRKQGRRGNRGRNLSASLFHLLFKNIGEIKEMENAGNYSMMKREALTALLSMKERVRYLPGLRTYIGFRQGYVDFIRDDRFSGDPKMSIRKLFLLGADAIFSFSRFPIRFCLILGIIGAVFFLVAGIYAIVAKISGFAIPGWTSTLLSIYFLGSVQLIFLGILGEYVYRNYKEAQNRPLFIIRNYYDDSQVSDDRKEI
jgi:dolichol-phosphate mannosyltransferase